MTLSRKEEEGGMVSRGVFNFGVTGGERGVTNDWKSDSFMFSVELDDGRITVGARPPPLELVVVVVVIVSEGDDCMGLGMRDDVDKVDGGREEEDEDGAKEEDTEEEEDDEDDVDDEDEEVDKMAATNDESAD